MTQPLTHLSLFSGIGGIDIAAEWAGFETVGQCEWADFPTKVLEKHWPNVPRWRDIRDVAKEDFQRRTGRKTVDIISGGFPCQPFSVASVTWGGRKGKEDERYLWPEMLRVISELQPTWVLGENVPGIINMALDDVCTSLENQGYEVQPLIIPACAVGASHRRDRVFIIAHSLFKHVARGGQDEIQGFSTVQSKLHDGSAADWPGRCSVYQPKLSRTFNGVPDQVDRIKSLGNAVVPQQVFPILKAIADIERIKQ